MEDFTMARISKREYLRSIYRRYGQARRRHKTAMLEEFCKVCGYNRKYAIWLLGHPLAKAAAQRRNIRRSPTYSKTAIGILAKVWQRPAATCALSVSRPCSRTGCPGSKSTSISVESWKNNSWRSAPVKWTDASASTSAS